MYAIENMFDGTNDENAFNCFTFDNYVNECAANGCTVKAIEDFEIQEFHHPINEEDTHIVLNSEGEAVASVRFEYR